MTEGFEMATHSIQARRLGAFAAALALVTIAGGLSGCAGDPPATTTTRTVTTDTTAPVAPPPQQTTTVERTTTTNP
jgi:type IV pilus biogenesis protein CpaD/CtpE